jgi:hypothetical protein
MRPWFMLPPFTWIAEIGLAIRSKQCDFVFGEQSGENVLASNKNATTAFTWR